MKKKENSKLVILVADHVKPRVAKIGYALRKKGYRVILFLEKINKKEISKVDKKYYDFIVFFKTKEELYRKCSLFSPLVYHLFSEAVVTEWAEYIIRKKDTLGKIVYDQYDVYRDFVSKKEDQIVKREKYCLENADGLCCRMFETQYLKKMYEYKYRGKRILFLDYCWNLYKEEMKPSKGKVKFVYGGRLLNKTTRNIKKYKMELNGFKHICSVTHDENAYFIIIPTVLMKNIKDNNYKKLKEKYNNVIFKEPMDFKKLIKYESYMDYGIDCVELERDIVHLFDNDSCIRNKYKYYATNKYFDYLDAGIMPIYGRKQEMFGAYLEHYGGAVRCSLEELPQKINQLKNCRVQNKEKAYRAREILSIDNQIQRLINFYKDI